MGKMAQYRVKACVDKIMSLFQDWSLRSSMKYLSALFWIWTLLFLGSIISCSEYHSWLRNKYFKQLMVDFMKISSDKKKLEENWLQSHYEKWIVADAEFLTQFLDFFFLSEEPLGYWEYTDKQLHNSKFVMYSFIYSETFHFYNNEL